MSNAEQPVHDVESWLTKIDRAEFLDKKVITKKHGRVAVRNFPAVCPDAAIEVFAGLDGTDPQDPEYPEMVEAAQFIFDRHFGDQIESVE